ncbi:MAG: sialidase family protein, partial [Verrucomicrobiota bacterium]
MNPQPPEPPTPHSSHSTPVGRRQFFQASLLGGLAAATSASSAPAASPTPVVARAAAPDATTGGVEDSGELPRAHPFWPHPRLTLITDHRKHRSRGSGLVILQDRWLFFWREADIHGASDPDSLVRMGESRNGGQTLENIRTIYREDHGITGTDIRARLMGKGRIGVFGSRRDSSDRKKGITLKPFFMFSDDGCVTWTKQVLENLPTAMSPSFTFNAFPAAVGGHDTEGYIVFCHGSGLYAVYTTDNGHTWRCKFLFASLGRLIRQRIPHI